MKQLSAAIRLASVVVLGIGLTALPAQASNILLNGSFENTPNGLNGWTISGTQLAYPPAVILTDGSAGSAWGESVVADPLSLGSPDLGGTHAVYFVDDGANQTLSQLVWLPVGIYEVGFDAWVPQNGFNNPVNAHFDGSIVSVNLADFWVKSQTPRVWQHFSGLADVSVASFYQVAFNFQTPGLGAAADVVVDRVYVVAGTGDGRPVPPPVPEPASMLLFGTGLVGLVGAARRRMKK